MDINLIEERVDEQYKALDGTQTGYATYMLAMMKSSMKWLYRVIFGLMATIAITVVAFVWLWQQYEYVSDIEMTGVYNLMDSNGNVIASDVTPEMLEAFEEWWSIYGENQSNAKP